MSTVLRVIAYLRQSEERPGEDKQTSLSLRSQEDRFRAWCAEHDATPVQVIADHDLRGWDPARPGIRQLLDASERERPDAVWVLSLSRFARDHILQELIWRDLQARGVQQLVSDIESGTDDPFIRGIYGLMHAKSKTEQSAHLRNAFARRARDGGFPQGPTPLGYRRPHRITIHRANGTSYERETGEPVIDEERATTVRMIFDRFCAGDSLHAIANDLAREGAGSRGGTWTRSTVRRILQSPIYCGDIAHKSEVVAHNDTWAIVPRAQWDHAQTLLTRAVVTRNGQHHHWLDDLVEHGCGQRMYYQPDQRSNAGQFGCRTAWELPASRCQVERRHVSAAILVRIVRHILDRDMATRRTPETAVAAALALAGGRTASRARAAAERRLRSAEERWARVFDRYGEGKVPPAMMDAEDARRDTARAQYRQELANLPSPPDVTEIEASSATLDRMASLLQDANDAELRQLLTALGRVVVDERGIAIRYHPEFAPLFASEPVPVPRYGRGWRT